MLDPEYIGMSLIAILTNCLEIYISLCNDPIGLIQKGHLNGEKTGSLAHRHFGDNHLQKNGQHHCNNL